MIRVTIDVIDEPKSSDFTSPAAMMWGAVQRMADEIGDATVFDLSIVVHKNYAQPPGH